MSKLKDKLSANMRAVKAKQVAPKPVSVPAKPMNKTGGKTATNPVSRHAPVAGNALRDEVPNSGTTLFPTRVWPD